MAGMDCHSNFYFQYYWQNQYYLVEQRRTGVREDYVALGVAIQYFGMEVEPVYQEGISQELSNKTRVTLP